MLILLNSFTYLDSFLKYSKQRSGKFYSFSSFSSIEEKKLAGQFKHKLFCSYFVQNFTFIIFSPNLKLHFKDHGFSLQISKMSLFTIYLP